MKMKFKLLSITLILTLMFSLTACSSNSQPIVSSKGKLLEMSYKELEKNNRTGFYVKTKDNKFSPLMNLADGYAGTPSTVGFNDENISTRYLWFTNNKDKISDLIPVIKKGGDLIFVFTENDEIPSEFPLEKYDFKGYTIGCHIYKGADNSLYIESEKMLPGSDAATTMSVLNSEDTFKIQAINGSDVLPVNNVDNNMRIILGLEKDKKYSFDFYKGTKYLELDTVADTFIFQCSDITYLENPYTRTKEGYFKINLPDNLKKGYYYICGLGMFKYEQ